MQKAHCKNCNKEFEYKSVNNGKSCSRECTNGIISDSKTKYSQSQVDQVIQLKKGGIFNAEIVKITGVKLSKVKEIVNKNKLFVDKKEGQERAYRAKLAKNPKAMAEMRGTYKNKANSLESLNSVKETLLSAGYEYIEGYKGKSKPFSIRCLRCQTVRVTSKINTVVKDTCAKCSGVFKTSAAEIEISEWFQSLGLKVEKYKFASRAGGIEIDVYLPELKLGIEYCGLYWHNENSPTPRPRAYHHNKMLKANKDGIRLITVFQDEWRDRKDQVKGFLRSVVGQNQIKLYARKTTLRKLTKLEVKAFMDANHIQGAAKTDSAFGLFKGEELVGAISGNVHHRLAEGNSYVLNRLAFKSNYSVAGGASRLVKALVDHAKQIGYKKLISWSDNRWSEGNVYLKTGFTLESTLNPDYSYVFGQNRVSKQSCQKKFLLAKGAIGNTESEMATSLGYNKIWDCGKKRWVLLIG